MKIISSLIFLLFSLGIWSSLFTMVYYQYERQQLLNAYKAVKNDNISIRNAAKQYGIPRSTLQDRVKERINIDAISVKQTFFSADEEIKLVSHVKDMASRGYGYTRAEVCHIASDYARWLGKASQGDIFSMNWLYCRMERHPGLSVNQPKGLSSARTAASSPEVIESFFTQLFVIHEKYDLTYSPERIYKIDEEGFNAEHKPLNVLAPMKRKIYSITSPRSTTATLIGASNTLGMSVPPFIFFFKGNGWMINWCMISLIRLVWLSVSRGGGTVPYLASISPTISLGMCRGQALGRITYWCCTMVTKAISPLV